MFVGDVDLVFDVIFRRLQLANVVIVSPHSNQQAIGPNRLGARLGQRSNDDAVVIGPRSLHGKASQNGGIQAGELEQFDIGGNSEH